MNNNDIHETVSKAYTQALEASRTRSGGCCGPVKEEGGCCGSTPSVADVTAAQAGYGDERERFAEAGRSSFGCGNPLAFAGVEPGQVVLDLGSGAGLDLLIAAEKVGATGRVIGVDMTDAMLEAARENARRAGFDQIELRKGTIEELPVEDTSVDWVISNCVINLSPDKERVFAEIARVLKPGGQVSISDIVATDLPQWIRDNKHAYAACVAGAIDEDAYRAGLLEAGLQEVEVVDRLVYDAASIRGMVESDLRHLGIDPEALGTLFEDLEGKVWSAKFVARRGA